MRALVDFDMKQIRELDRLAKNQRRSRAALVREAVTAYLERNKPADADIAFGLWGGDAEDGLAYQEKIRAEW